MRSSRAVVETRRNRLLKSLYESGAVNIQEIAGEMGVSPLTVRRDLLKLEEVEKITRFYGGASLGKNAGAEEGNIFSSAFTLNKTAIARYAAALVEDGDTIFINTSSTAAGMIPFITAKHVTVITNNARAMEAERPKDMILIFTGGEMRFPKEAMVGDFAVNNLSTVTASKCFLGCNGLTAREGLTTAMMQEASVNHLMLTRVTGPRYILADKSKIGRRLNFIYGSLGEITMLITDTEAPPEMVEELRQRIEVYQVEPLSTL
ncbi:MAG: DeoR/GlpR family DNA-binding transcription regulator [Spirochaetaceae bacterium]|jgi:DeoR/GlpR family transcriptional regulator of sugar metabolism|nr:DeoR/GlpR family DNA-binding transcription regulator [Spirochaetaceae bacterium]